MKGKVVFSMKTWPYLINEKQERYTLRPMVRGICGGIAGLIASLMMHSLFRPVQSLIQILMYALVYGFLFSVISIINMGIACLLGKAGCNVFSQ